MRLLYQYHQYVRFNKQISLNCFIFFLVRFIKYILSNAKIRKKPTLISSSQQNSILIYDYAKCTGVLVWHADFSLRFPVLVHTHSICDSLDNPWDIVNICVPLYMVKLMHTFVWLPMKNFDIQDLNYYEEKILSF